MRRTVPLERPAVRKVWTAPQESCPFCDGRLQVCQHRKRRIHALDETVLLTLRDKRCVHPGCPHPEIRYRPAAETLLALPDHEFGLDVILAIGSMRLRDDFSFPRIYQRLHERPAPVPICPQLAGNSQYLGLRR